MISSQALVSVLPEPQDRGSFMSINSSIMQISGGIAAIIAGKIVSKGTDGTLLNYDLLGYSVMCSVILAIFLYYRLDVQLRNTKAIPKV
jgi:predicted MFS family arabinose efflux permease